MSINLMLIIETIFFPSVKKRSLPHGRHMWAKCSQQPAPTCPPRCLIWCIKTGPLLQCGSTCLVLKTSAPWPCKAENRFTRGSIDMSWPVCICLGFRSSHACWWHPLMASSIFTMWTHKMEESVSLSKNTGASHADINVLKEIWYWQSPWIAETVTTPKR